MTSLDWKEPQAPDDMERGNAGLYVLGGAAIIVSVVWLFGPWWM
jgi:hypothetical protein